MFTIVNMSLLQRTRHLLGDAIVRDSALICLADGIVGLAFGAAVVAGGLPWWIPILTSVAVFAGGSQIAATSVAIAGGGPVAAVAAGALLNTRLMPYGFAVADVAAGLPWWKRVLAAHLTTDESTALKLRGSSAKEAARAFWTCGGMLFIVWNIAVVLGVLGGASIRNTSAFGLDAAFPAIMLALALPALKDRSAQVAAAAGAALAVALTPVLAAGLPLLASLAAVVLAVPAVLRSRR